MQDQVKGNKGFLLPSYRFNRVTDITPEFLAKIGVKALLLDVDNTLSTHHGQTPVDGLHDWLISMQSAGIRLLILSNATKNRVEPFADKLLLPFLSLSMKPLIHGYLRALHRLKVGRKNVAMVGDQLFTDVLGAKALRIKSILVNPILLENKNGFVLRRRIEARILKKMPFKKETL